MLQKNQANAIAEAMLNQPQVARHEYDKSAVRPVAMLYRCRELSLLEPWQRKEVVRQAATVVKRKPLFFFLVFLWFVAIVAIFLQIYGSLHSSAIMPFVFSSWIVPFFLRALFIRSEVRKISAELLSSDSDSNAQD